MNYIVVLEVIDKRGGVIMSRICLRVNEDECKLIDEYVCVKELNMREFIGDGVVDKIENDVDVDEDGMLYGFEKGKEEKRYDDSEVWKMVGV